MGVTNILPFISDYQGSVADPPIMARVSMIAEGATAVKKECCIILADLRKVKDEKFLMKE